MPATVVRPVSNVLRNFKGLRYPSPGALGWRGRKILPLGPRSAGKPRRTGRRPSLRFRPLKSGPAFRTLGIALRGFGSGGTLGHITGPAPAGTRRSKDRRDGRSPVNPLKQFPKSFEGIRFPGSERFGTGLAEQALVLAPSAAIQPVGKNCKGDDRRGLSKEAQS